MRATLSILLVTNNYLPYSGGVVSSITTQADELRKQGHSVTIVTLDFLPHYSTDENHIIRLYCPLRFLYKKNHMAIPWRATHQLSNIIQKVKPAIIHVHHPFLLGKAAYRVARKYGIPIVFTYHTLYMHYLHYIPLLPTWMTKPIVQRLVDNFCNAVDGIIAPSSIVIEQLKKQHITTKTTLIPSAISSVFFKVPPHLPKVPQKPFQLITVSRFVKEKNIPFLLDVVAQLDPTKYALKLIGYGSEALALKKYAYNYKKMSESNVQFIERVPKEKLIAFYQHADLFLFASTSETQGLVLAEAMSQGVPIVSLYGPGQRDVIQQGKNGFLVHSKDDMKNTIQLLAGDPSLLSTLQNNAVQTAQQFTPEKTTTKLLDFYQEIIASYKKQGNKRKTYFKLA